MSFVACWSKGVTNKVLHILPIVRQIKDFLIFTRFKSQIVA